MPLAVLVVFPVLLTTVVSVAGLACAASSAEEARALGVELTPLGGERRGNAEGAIPAWDGGQSRPDGTGSGSAQIDPFPAEHPLFSVSANNVEAYAARLTDGAKALLRKYPDTYRIDVYPTHRTAAAPAWVYDATRRNATMATLVEGSSGLVAQNAYAGVPFPLPKNGAEAIWNHVLRWRGVAHQRQFANFMITAAGTRVVVDGGVTDVQLPYYAFDGLAHFDGDYSIMRIVSDAPPQRHGVEYVERNNLDGNRNVAWAYLPGQRRVRKLPVSCCDTPLPSAAGVITFDEVDVYNGRIDRFDWTLIGKAERYIPYNTNRSLNVSVDELMRPHHLNPQHVRWELHRVWIIEAKLRAGQRHSVARARYYLDEDTWLAVLGDRWDADGRLIKTLWALPLTLPEMPGVTAVTSGAHDLVTGTWIAMAVLNDRPDPYKIVPPWPDSHFTADAMAGEGVR
jgi:hypothetical protein